MITKMPYAMKQVDNMLAVMDSVIDMTLVMLTDKEIDLEARWDLYLKIEKVLPISQYLSQSIYVLTDEVYNDFFPDGKGMRYNSSIDEGMAEEGSYLLEQKAAAAEAGTDWVPDRYDERVLKQYEKRDAWREAVLAEGVGGFVFDW